MGDSHTASIDRRGFCKAATAAAAGLILASECTLTGCSTEEQENVAQNLATGEWINAACPTHQCGSRCVNRIYVVDGIPVKQKTDDTHPDSFDYPQQRGCVKGRLNRQYVLADDRLKFPMKRKNWQPGGKDYHPELRGKDEWVRISWEEAVKIIADEYKRIKETYGNEAFLQAGLYDTRWVSGFMSSWLLNAYGGASTVWGQQSAGARKLPTKLMTGSNSASDKYCLLKSKLIVLWGANPAWSFACNNTWLFSELKKRGVKIIMVDPQYSATAQAVADQWIPVRPGTDAALLCALAHYMIVNDLHDQAFLDKCTVGFDAEHMPEGYEDGENFKDYILGVYDGVPKTPEWASEICGTPVETIEQLAREMATTKPMALKAGMSPQRSHNGTNLIQLFYTVGWMCGNVGTPGGEVTTIGGANPASWFGGPRLLSYGPDLVTPPENGVCTNARGGGSLESGGYDPSKYYGVAYAEMHSAILSGEVTDFVHGKRKVNFKAFISDGIANALNQTVNANTGYKAFRAEGKLEFVLAADLFMTTDCLFADLVLPACTTWENGHETYLAGERDMLVWGNRVVDPLYEAKPEWEWQLEVANLLGIDPSVVEPMPQDIVQMSRLANSTVAINSNYETEFLAEVTQEDIDEFGLVVEPHEGRIPFKELMREGKYQIERTEDDGYDWVAYKDFVEDPEGNPLGTSTGKFEIYCPALAAAIANFNTTPLDALPKYVKSVDGYEDSFEDWESKTKGEYPYQMVTTHYLGRAHSMYGNLRTLNEIHPDDMLMNPIDAEASGVSNGDTCLVSSAYGKILRRVTVTERIMPGVLSLGEGNWTNLDDETGIDFGGNVNTLEGGHMVGEGFCSFNSLLVKVEKWSGDPLQPLYLQPVRAFDDEGGKLW